MSLQLRIGSVVVFTTGLWMASTQINAGNPIALAHFNPGNPRPDFLPHTLYNNWASYRAEYNRPHPIGGHIASVIEPTSQEAMAWCIHQANGDYRNKRPGYVPHYNYPKPWEALPTMGRPNAPLVP